MSPLTLILREIRHRWGAFLLSSLGVAVAVAVVLAAALLLEQDRRETERLLTKKRAEIEHRIAAREAEVEQSGKELQDAIRKQMVKLGFNVLILPEEQELGELHLEGTLSSTMPESYVGKLADSGVITINHLLPMVTKRVAWPEREAEVILVGTRGEVPILHRALKKPILDAVAPGEMVVGYDLHQKLGLTEGETVPFMGKELRISKLHPQRGTTDDVTLWIDLGQAQELLGMQNLIHGMLALECECAGDRISAVRSEIQGVLPGTQVVERYSQALARAEARAQAAATAEEALAAEQQAGAESLQQEEAARRDIEDRHAELAHWLVPVVIVASAVWVGLLAFLNVRQRREEIGILRAIGLRRRGVIAVFEGKAILIGLTGGIVGVLVGLGLTSGGNLSPGTIGELWETPGLGRLLLAAPLAAVLFAAIASWVPALLAANQDPALILEQE